MIDIILGGRDVEVNKIKEKNKIYIYGVYILVRMFRYKYNEWLKYVVCGWWLILKEKNKGGKCGRNVRGVRIF